MYRDENVAAQISTDVLRRVPRSSESRAAGQRLKIQCLKRTNHTDSKVVPVMEIHAAGLPADEGGNTEFFSRVFSSPSVTGLTN